MTKQPKFIAGDKVKTNLWKKRRTGTVIECINAGDPDDVRTQGFRYYVRLGKHKHVYSITEMWLWQ